MPGKAYKSVTIAYFSGTGGTKLAAEYLEQQWKERGIQTTMQVIESEKPGQLPETDLFILLSPVYAFRLASIVEDWISNLSKVSHTPAAIISVSAGGEISPNTACRVRCKRLLRKKGYSVIYETMLVMPSNFSVQTPPELAKQLITVLPHKVSGIVSDLLSGTERITKPIPKDRCFAFLGRGEHLGARFFGKSIRVMEDCTQCGLCQKNCPTKNIRDGEGTPQFGFRCIMCCKCVYLCPVQAIKPKLFPAFEDGYDLDEMKEFVVEAEGKEADTLAWKGVREYLQEACETVDSNVAT